MGRGLKRGIDAIQTSRAHIINSTSPIEMFFGCFSGGARPKCSFSSKNKFFNEVTTRLIPEEINILTLIYDDLASRNLLMRLTFDNFLSFFDLTGLWGAKLFESFDEDKQEVISFEEFLYGISRTAKAPFEQKIRLLYCFFQDEEDDGIEFKNFTKMLYNYSKEELKEIIIEDTVLPKSESPPKRSLLRHESTIIEVDVPNKKEKPSNSFDLAYQYLMDAHEDSTFYEISTSDLTYKVKYSNMSTLIEEFASQVYLQHGINVREHKNPKLSYESFSLWVKSHKKLFKSYYSAFHMDLWAYQDGSPSYLNRKFDLEFKGKMECGGVKEKVFAIQVGDAIMVCESKKKIKYPFKIICLEGLTIREVEGLAIEINHVSEVYKKVLFYFEKEEEFRMWMSHLKIYEHDSLHSNYFTGEAIGTGKFSIVYKCVEKSTHKTFALKVIDIEKLTPQGRKAISNESETMKILNHPQIVKYKETIRTKNFEYIITEYIYGEDLFEYVKKRGSLNEFESAFIIGNIMKAVMFLHGMGILHRDLKPENIMVMFKEKKQNEYFECTTPLIRKGQRIENIKIIDFGLSNHIANLKKMERKDMVVGTPNYIAPEVLLCQEPTFKSDNFAVGCILYFLLRGRLPFAEGNAEKTLKNTVRGDYELEGEAWDRISYEAKSLIIQLLEVEPEQRIDLDEAMNHEWFSVVHTIARSSKTHSVNSQKGQEDHKEVAEPEQQVKGFLQRISSEQHNNSDSELNECCGESSVRYSK